MVIIHGKIILFFIVIIIGKIITISISKIRNKIAIRKNWIEKGMRDDLIGSNPHSNGDIFSRSRIVFFEIIEHIIINNNEIKQHNAIVNNIKNITFSLLKIFWLEVKYILYTKKVTTSSVNWNIKK